MKRTLMLLAVVLLLPALCGAADDFRRMTWPDLAKVTGQHRVLVISMGGLGTGDVDGIKDLAKEFADGRADVLAVYGAPHLALKTVSVDGKLNDNDLGPDPKPLAGRINAILAGMSPETKLIVIGKSMGGCKLLKALGRINRTVDLLITVDASCDVACHDKEVKYIGSNVRNAYNFRQRDNGRRGGCGQCGYKVARAENSAESSPVYDVDVNVDEEFSGAGTLCNGCDHCTIDNCGGLLNRIRKLVANEISR